MFGITDGKVNLFCGRKNPTLHFHSTIYTHCALTLLSEKWDWKTLTPTALGSILNPISNKRGGFPPLLKLQFSRESIWSSHPHASLHSTAQTWCKPPLSSHNHWTNVIYACGIRPQKGRTTHGLIHASRHCHIAHSLLNYCRRQGQLTQFMMMSGWAPLSPLHIFQR